MAAAASLAADAAGAFGPRSAAFALSYAVLSGLLALLYARARRRGPAHQHRLVDTMLVSLAISASLWVASVLVPPPWRYALWGLGLTVEIAVPLVGGSLLRPVDGKHLPERFGTFVIIVLGQVVVAAILGISAVHRDARSVAAGALCFIIAVAIWWGYFDFVAFAARYGLLRAKSHGTLARDIYAYGHLPIVFGISLTGVGAWMAIEQSNAAVISLPGRLLLLGGLLLVYLGNGAVSWGVTRSLRGSVSWPRSVATVALLTLLALGGYASPVVLLVLIDVTLVASLALEVVSERRFGLRLRTPRGPGPSER